MCIVMLVCMTESTADMLALGKIVGRLADERTIEGGLRADTLGSALSPLFNGFANSAFAQNIGLVAMTKVRSRFVVATGGVILIVLGLSPVAASAISLVPLPVLGGAGIVLFGSVAASGIPVSVYKRQAMEKGENSLIVAASVGIGLIPIAAPDFYHNLPKDMLVILDSGISTGCLVAIVLNLAFNHFGKGGDGAEEADTGAVTAETQAEAGADAADGPDVVDGPDAATPTEVAIPQQADRRAKDPGSGEPASAPTP